MELGISGSGPEGRATRAVVERLRRGSHALFVGVADVEQHRHVGVDPPNGTELSREQERLLAQAIVEMLGSEASRVVRTFEMLDDAHPRDVPHFYLSLLGTRAAHRGRGHGLGLLEQNLLRIDATGMPSYLEASNPANVALYERYGFAVRDSFKLPADGPEVFTMWRDPRPCE
jgi:ribosomal protein S18 acetylase RimI-like enzyme